MLMYENGYSTAEIADQLGIREDLVRKEKSLGLRELRSNPAFSALAS
jgi:DNA-directed RNA polymerase specialized sigma24 family protein